MILRNCAPGGGVRVLALRCQATALFSLFQSESPSALLSEIGNPFSWTRFLASRRGDRREDMLLPLGSDWTGTQLGCFFFFKSIFLLLRFWPFSSLVFLFYRNVFFWSTLQHHLSILWDPNDWFLLKIDQIDRNHFLSSSLSWSTFVSSFVTKRLNNFCTILATSETVFFNPLKWIRIKNSTDYRLIIIGNRYQVVAGTDDVSVLISDPTENLLKENKGTNWGPINTGVQKGKRMSRNLTEKIHSYHLWVILCWESPPAR